MCAMPMPSRGPRLRVHSRLTPDLYRETARRAKARGWSMSDYVAWCIGRVVAPSKTRDQNRTQESPYVDPDVGAGLIPRDGRSDRYEEVQSG